MAALVDGGNYKSTSHTSGHAAAARSTPIHAPERPVATPLEHAADKRRDAVAQAQTAHRDLDKLHSMRPNPAIRAELNEARQQAAQRDRAAAEAVAKESRIAHETLSPSMAERYDQDVAAEYRGDKHATDLVQRAQAAPKVTADQASDDIVKRETHEDCTISVPFVGGINCRQDVNGEAVGKEIAATAKTDPVRAQEMLDKALGQAPDAGDRREIARGVTENLSGEELRKAASTPAGRAMLDRAKTELAAGGAPNDSENKAITRIETAIKADALSKDPAFKKLDAATQKQTLDQIARHDGDAAAVDNVVALAKSSGFQSASPAVRAQALKALDAHAGDKIYREGLDKLLANPDFAKLNPAQQADAIQAFNDFASREAYTGKEGSWFFNVGAKSVSDADKRKVLDNVISVVTSKGFHDVAPEARQAMLGALERHATDAGFTGRLVTLVNDTGFLALNNKGKEVELLKNYGKDEHFAAGVDTVVASGAYTALGGADRAKVLDDVTRLVKTDGYKDTGNDHKQEMVEAFGDISSYSAAHADRVSIRNSIDRVLSGEIKLSVYQEAAAGGYIKLGYATEDGIFLNTHADARGPGSVEANADTLVHEVNHFVNGNTDAGTADRFLDEYRAAVVGQEARLGRSLTADEQRAIVDNLVDGNNAAYSHLHDLYNNDATFKEFIDDLRVTLDGNFDPAVNAAPAPVSPEQARHRLIDAGITSDYLEKAGDLDN